MSDNKKTFNMSYGYETIETKELATIDLNTHDVQRCFRGIRKHPLLSEVINQLQSLLDEYGDGYINLPRDEYTDEVTTICVEDETISINFKESGDEQKFTNRFFGIS